MRVPRPVIALLTDFGLSDHYVAAMKGVMLGIAPDATLLDITHGIAPQDVLGASLELEAVSPYLPDGTIVVAVVDPGVGTSRRAIAVDAGRLRLVGPDNGLFTLMTDGLPDVHAVELANSRFLRPASSRTFEGRDRFAPVAAHLAVGLPLDELGPPARGLVRLDVAAPVVRADAIDGQVLRADHFGNLLTNIRRSALDALAPACDVLVAGHRLRVSATYGEGEPGALMALVGSTERLEIAVNGGSAASVLGLGRGAVVSVRVR